ncbi:MAG: Ku protein [Austwickia sp.]|nr:Ku protein [Austwickia sp.]
MRAMWKGAVSFGLVTVPVRMYSATESHDLQFRQVRASDGSRIRYRRVAEADGAEVPYDQIVKGYETPDGRMVVLTDDDLAALPNRSSKEIEVDKFVPAEQIDPILFDKAYYLEPDKASAKSYSLLRETLRAADRMAVVTISVRSRMTMAVLRVREDVIVLQTLLWPDEIRKPEFDTLADVPEPSEREVKMAHLLVESLSEDFDPAEYEDDYAEAVEALVQAKIAGGKVETPAAAEESPGQVVDLLAALQQSVDRAKAARAAASGNPASAPGAEQQAAEESPASPASPAAPAAPKKTAAKKAPAKKAAAKAGDPKKTPAKKAG